MESEDPQAGRRGDSPEKPTLADLRYRAGLTQGALASAAGVSRAAIAKMELGLHAPNVDTLEKLAAILGPEVLTARYGWSRKPSGSGRRGRPPREDPDLDEGHKS